MIFRISEGIHQTSLSLSLLIQWCLSHHRGVEVKVEGLDGKNHHLRITNLASAIKPDASYHKVKTGEQH